MPGVVATAVGYTGGATEKPTYEKVCGGGTGHAEAVLIEFDPKKISYDQLLEVFWANHTPTADRKGQYRSAVFTYGDSQAASASKSASAVAKRLNQPVATQITPAATFWMAEDYHQQYFDKTGVYACPAR